MAEVRLDAVSKTFGSSGGLVRAVDDVTLDVADHEFMILLGPSGCGKSTLLRMVAGLEDPTEGDIWIGDTRVNDVLPKARDVAMVFQSYALYPHKTVRANIEFPLKVRGASRAERGAEADRAAEVLGLSELMDRKPGQLSGGQRQRVALARAIVRRPAVFCMDEPLSNLDAKLRGETRAELVDLHRRLDSTFLYVTHDQVEAMTMGSRIAVMSAGRLQQVGTPSEVYARPETVFVAQFIGTPPMNILPPGLLDSGANSGPRDTGADEVIVGIRPEHVVLTPHGAHLAHVRLVEQLGHEILVTCELVDRRVDATVGAAATTDGASGSTASNVVGTSASSMTDAAPTIDVHDSAAADSGTPRGPTRRVVVRLAADHVAPALGQDVLLDFPEAHRHHFDAANGRRLP